MGKHEWVIEEYLRPNSCHPIVMYLEYFGYPPPTPGRSKHWYNQCSWHRLEGDDTGFKYRVA